MVQQAQFSESPLDDPNIHLVMFLEICDTVKINGVTEYTIRLRLFPFSLRDKARVDAASGGTLMSKTAEGATYLLEEMTSNNYQWPSERTMTKKVVGIHELEPLATLSAQVATLSHQISALTTQRIPQNSEYVAATSIIVPSNEASQEQVQYINNQNYNYRGNPMPNYYHTGLQNHENLSYRNTKNVLQPPPGFDSQQSEKKVSLEDAMIFFVEETNARFKKTDSWLNNIETHCSNMGAAIKNIEV
ncbi:hypothetical protein F2P56_013038 [Juglans regia]|uniref:Uncharacterized protein LOC108997516 n=2 Tax=Juglans regia TaxID=51240 RepID=A0A2I4FCJ6_JUGRE|nr:uncharacterized protein LOC108997516 [Juglans regia]KAF5468930.1 hypothetical protein F2P56_013038 [Juglans regia]